MKVTWRMLVWMVLVPAAFAWPGFGADLTEALPAEAVMVLRVTGAQAAWQRFFASETWKRIENSPFPEVNDGIARARQQIADLERATGQSLDDGLASIFGTDALIALLPDQRAVFLARTPNQTKLEAAINTLHAIERNDGKLIGEPTETYDGVLINGDVLADRARGELGQKRRHYARMGDLLAVSEDIAVVKRVIDVTKGKAPALAAEKKYQEATDSLLMRSIQRLPPTPLVRIYVDTARLNEVQGLEALFDGALRNPGVKLLAGRIKQALASTRYLVGDLTNDGGALQARYILAYDLDKAPATLRALDPAPGARLDILRLIPPNAIAAYANQFNKAALWRYILESVREADPRAADRLVAQANLIGNAIAGMDFEKELLPLIGEQNALVITPGAPGNPPVVSLLIEMRESAGIVAALKTLAGAAVAANKAESDKAGRPPQAVLTRSRYRDTDLTTLELKEAKFAGKLNPTLFVTGRFLVLTTSPDGARAILDVAAPAPALPADATDAAQLSAGRLDFGALTAVVAQYRDFLIQQGIKDGKPEAKAREDTRNLELLLTLAQRIDVSGSYASGRVERRLTIRY